jgi:hypothetical protein
MNAGANSIAPTKKPWGIATTLLATSDRIPRDVRFEIKDRLPTRIGSSITGTMNQTKIEDCGMPAQGCARSGVRGVLQRSAGDVSEASVSAILL